MLRPAPAGGAVAVCSVFGSFFFGSFACKGCATLPAPMTPYRCKEVTAADFTALLGAIVGTPHGSLPQREKCGVRSFCTCLRALGTGPSNT